ncbi:MAG: glycosyl hydrolase 53 family protein, partial [Erysipelotrichaceae bacterium]|nr:glycosyl hydrolase 53 family protein [Erysipelotrichaceae bacterium]
MKKIMKILLVLTLLLPLCSCLGKTAVEKVSSSDSLYVRKIEGLDDGFIMGMDVSSVLSLEESGVKFYDYDGKEADLFQILAESGITHIRVRVWNDPYDEEGHGYGG